MNQCESGLVRTLARFEERRAVLLEAEIPSAFLPSAIELGRTDLV